MGGNSERAEGRVEAKGAVVIASPEAVPPAAAKDGFFKRLWRRLIGATVNESVSAIPPPIQTPAETPAEIIETHEESTVEPPPSEPPVVERDLVSVQSDQVAVVEVFKIETPKGGVFYVRKDDWETRRSKDDVPLCDVAGQPVPAGQRTKLRESSILVSKLTLLVASASAHERASADASEYLPPPAVEAPENLTL